MITGAAIAVAGLIMGVTGALRFRVDVMIAGWLIAGGGAVLFLSSLVRFP